MEIIGWNDPVCWNGMCLLWQKGKVMDELEKSVVLLDYFTKTYCRMPNDYETYGDLKFRCTECPFYKEDGTCLVKQFKCKYAPEYKDFGCMGDL